MVKTGAKLSCPGKAVTLKNIMEDDKSMVDTLHMKAVQQSTKQTSCTAHKCLGSIMTDSFPNKHPRSKEETLDQAKDFIHQFFASTKSLDTKAYDSRMKEVVSAINKTGSYEMTYDELVFGTKTAWRNAPRCIGRIQWSKLEIFDCRKVKTAREMADGILRHLKYVTNGGNIRSAITVFPQRKFGTTANDFKVWNPLMIGYAGYKQPDGSVIGDPKSVDLTEVALKLGWKSKGTRFDVLPLVLQANGQDPEFFEIPPEYILEVNLKHPNFPKFEELGLKWFAVPGVANMLFDCGGLEFTGCPFSGWYMSTEVATRDLCDTGRYNILKEAAEAFGIPTGTNMTLWKDKVCVEINIAVLDSYNKCNVTIMDHHSASESFMKHMANEQKLRGGCPADWVWIVPPMSGSLTQVFHMEMAYYKLRPSYEYQDSSWITHKWKQAKNIAVFGTNDKVHTMKGSAIAVMFASILIRKMLSKRKRCTILYATETGRSHMFASKLLQVFKHAFNTHMLCMEDYDLKRLRKEQLLMVVAATTGNGDAPANGESFKEKSTKLIDNWQKDNVEIVDKQSWCCLPQNRAKVGSFAMPSLPPLSQAKYSIFGLGSRAYPQFCQFAHDIDDVLSGLAGTCLHPTGEGCEIEGQDEPFNDWATAVFKDACKEYKIADSVAKEGVAILGTIDKSWKPGKFQVMNVDGKEPQLVEGLTTLHDKMVKDCTLKAKMNLQPSSSDRQTLLVGLSHDQSDHFHYVPGDHIGIFPANDETLVQNILNKLKDCPAKHQSFSIEIQEETASGEYQWSEFSRLPTTTVRQALTHYLDITTPPSQKVLSQMVQLAGDKSDKDKLQLLSKNSKEYNKWKNHHWPNIAEIFDLFPSIKIPATFLLTQLPVLQQRYYSISSSPKKSPGQIDITIALVEYKTEGGNGPTHKGVCSGYLEGLAEGESIPCFLRSSGSFHMPRDSKAPIIMVGPGTGIAPFRSFWQQRRVDLKEYGNSKFGPMYMYFGCRTSADDDIYGEETKDAQKAGVITKVYTALSREPNKPKMYVQGYLLQNKHEIFKLMSQQGGHFYVCGAVTMAQQVNNVLIQILQEEGNMSEDNAKNYFARLKSEHRYHEDIFGAGFGAPSQTTTATSNGVPNGVKKSK